VRTAIIAAIVAMLISASSATAAFVVTSNSIKNGTIQLVDLSTNTKRALKGNQGPRGFSGLNGAPGAAGPQGPAGMRGPEGAAGGFDPNKVTYATGSGVAGPGSWGSASATCFSGKVVGGGFEISYGSLVVDKSAPSVIGSRWEVQMSNVGTTSGSFRVHAVCARP
jgi:hypothetical protein